MILSFKKSSVKVDADVSTNDDRVDIEADKTSTITIPMSKSGNVESIDGTMASYITEPSAL